jgi:replication initiator protein RepSA
VIEAAQAWLPLIRWLHMLGFRGHFNTKSRRYSTTLGRLRAERRSWRRRHEPNRWPTDNEDDQDERSG